MITKDWVQGVGHSPVCQMLQFVARAVITSSPSAWTRSAGMLSTPAVFHFFNEMCSRELKMISAVKNCNDNGVGNVSQRIFRLVFCSVVFLPALKPACSSTMIFCTCGFNLFSVVFSMTLLWMTDEADCSEVLALLQVAFLGKCDD